MSHRAFDELAYLRRRIAAIDAEIRAARSAGVVDFGALSDLRQTREALVAQLAAKGDAAR